MVETTYLHHWFFSQGRQKGISSMSKQDDKKILIALVFAQTSVLAVLIVLSPYFWIKKIEYRDDIRAQAEFGQFLKDQTMNIEAELKVQRLKRSFEKKGIGVEETFNLNSK